MIRKLTPSFIVFAALVSSVVGAEPQALLPIQPQLPLSPVPDSTHERMLMMESCEFGQPRYGDGLSQPAPVATWWSNSWAGRLVHQIGEDTCKANRWPEPYVQYDREATRAAFTTMVEKGWKRQNTLGNVHFDPDTGELNMSGRFKVRRIVLEGLPSRRDLFVYRADTMADTDMRLNSVKTFVHQLAGNGPTIPQVSVTNLPTPGWPAQYVDAITRKYIETMPDPRIPKKTEANFTED